MIVYLVRHGETDAMSRGLYGRAPGIALSEAGKLQANRLAEHLKNQSILAIYSSPLERTMETALALANLKGLSVQPAPAFIEVDQGDWTGLSWKEVHKDPTWAHYSTYRSGTSCPNGEMAIDVQARAVRALDRLLHQHEEQHIAIVTHADVIRAVICYYSGVPLDLSLRLEISTGSLSVLELRQDGARIVELNRTFAQPAQS